MKEQNALKTIALIKTGNTLEQVGSRHGDFEDWFARDMGVADLLQIDVFREQALPAVENLSAIVVTGSPAMVSAKEDWSERTAQWLRNALEKEIPALGVCYGHQLLAHALGGRVGPNPDGRQIGTVKVTLSEATEKDPLLGHLPKTFAAQASHSEAVLRLPPGAQRLAISPLDNNFAIRFRNNVWGVQFHPEFSEAVMSDYIRCRADALREEGLNPEQLLGSIADTKEARSVLGKFVKLLS